MLCLWSVKGGAGCTVTSAAVGLLAATRRETLLVDLGGDLGLALGVPAGVVGPSAAAESVTGNGWGIAGWFAAPCPPADALARFEQPVTDTLNLLPLGAGGSGERSEPDDERAAVLARMLAADERQVVVDLGLGLTTGVGRVPRWLDPFLDLADRSVLVTRSCYLGLSRAAASPHRPHAVVLVDEPGRALRPGDVADSIGVPVAARVVCEPAVARAIDAGVLARRLPRSLHPLRALLRPDLSVVGART